MSHTPEYEKLLAELNAKGLVRIIYCEEPGNNLSNDTRDRKIRKGIEYLRNLGFPIVSTSGKAGYKLDTDPKNIECMIRELKSRIMHLQQRVEAISSYYELFVRAPDTNRRDE